MRSESSTVSEAVTHGDATPRNGVLVLTGYGIRVAVERGHLLVRDGRGSERRAGRFSRADRSLRRLVVLGHTGTVSFDALRWLHDVGCAFLQIDADGTVLAAFGPFGPDDARMRRTQALAPYSGAGLSIAQDLITRKLERQAAVLDEMVTPGASEAAAFVRTCVPALAAATDEATLRFVEADAAGAYWAGWEGVAMRWAASDAERVPVHWRMFRSRLSPLSGGSRRAVNPVNALLNLCSALLECEARLAALAGGLDAGLGVLHADRPNRASLALDIMEPARPLVEQWVLDQLASRTFRRTDFWETREGACRLMAPLAKLVAEAVAPIARAAVVPEADRVARLLAVAASTWDGMMRPSTGAAVPYRPAGVRVVGDRPASDRRRPLVTSSALPPACRACGLILEQPGRLFCDDCGAVERAKNAALAVRTSTAAVAKMRAEGRDPTHGREAKRKRGEAVARRRAEAREWTQEHGSAAVDPDVFTRDILPGLATVPLRAMVEATGLGKSFCSLVRRGRSVPHQRHWEALAQLGDTYASDRSTDRNSPKPDTD